ncbi:MAG: SUMF1/EgtB/PvdO family nonheme iron enzyme, partial [bacterium]
MKRVATLTVLSILALLPRIAFAENINTPENFPDPVFRSKVETFMGVEPDGEFTAAQAAAKSGSLECVQTRNIHEPGNIRDLTGIKYLTGITQLDCYNNQLTSLDVSNNTALESLNCGYNRLTSLNVSGNAALHKLHCSHNELAGLDVSHNPALTLLRCEWNRLTELTLPDDTALEVLDCRCNRLNTLATFAQFVDFWNLGRMDVRYNLLDCDDWHDVQILKGRFGSAQLNLVSGYLEAGFAYSPQKELDPYDCPLLPIPTPTPTQPASPILKIIRLGVNSDTGLEEIRIDLPRMPENAKPLEMVLIPSGTFTMGSPQDERGRFNDWPEHEVTITHSFYFGEYELTNAQFAAFLNAEGNRSRDRFEYLKADSSATRIRRIDGVWTPDSGYENHPVTMISWFGARDFCVWLSELVGGLWVRLPTEAEWEYACRAGTASRFSFGDALECDDRYGYCALSDPYMWWYGNNTQGNMPDEEKEAGLKLPNPWGLYDMHGNVWEWCSDWWEDSHDRGPQVDPQGPRDSQFPQGVVVRGGSGLDAASECRSAARCSRSALRIGYRSTMLTFYGARIAASVGSQPTLAPTPTPMPTPGPGRTNPDTGLKEITVHLPGLPETATAKPLEMVLIPEGSF